MTSYDVRDIDLPDLLREMVKHSVKQGQIKTKTPTQLSGSVEALNDEELETLWVRMDDAAMSNDPTQSMNYGYPGVFPTTRIGEVFQGDTVRTTFDPFAGATSSRTNALKEIVIPFGAEEGELIRISEENGKGYIALFNAEGDLVAYWDPVSMEIGDLTTPGRRITIDPIGGFRFRSENDRLVLTINEHGFQLRDDETGLVTAELRHGSFRMVDPNGTDDLEMVTSSAGTLPNPKWAASPELNPGASLVVPLSPLFTTTPADDIEIAHVAAWERAADRSTAVMTPPGGYTARSDEIINDADGTLHTSIATLDPATGAAATFTDSVTTWQHGIGTHIVIKGGGAVSPSYGSVSHAEAKTLDGQITATINKPSGVAANGVLLAFVSLGVSGGGLPTGWVVPGEFFQLGAHVSLSGTGATQSTLAVGVWAKQTTADDVSATDYSTTINLPPGIKFLQTSMVYIADAFLVPGGVQIRAAGRPMRRLLDDNELTAASGTLCDFQNISQGYQHLELVIDASAAAAGADTRIFMRFNGNLTGNVFSRLTQLHTGGSTVEGSVSAVRCGAVSGSAAAQTSASLNIYGYTQLRRRVVMGQHYWVDSAVLLRHDMISAQWDNVTDPITRITVDCAKSFAIGSRAFLYGY